MSIPDPAGISYHIALHNPISEADLILEVGSALPESRIGPSIVL